MGYDTVKPAENQLELAISLTIQALEICDSEGLVLAAIDLCAAAEKLKTFRTC